MFLFLGVLLPDLPKALINSKEWGTIWLRNPQRRKQIIELWISLLKLSGKNYDREKDG
jgi:hypothetical protein